MTDENKATEQARDYQLRFEALWDGLTEDLPGGHPDLALRQMLAVLTNLAMRKKVPDEDIVSALIDEANAWSAQLAETEAAP
jgi:hypothetical protein